MNSSDGEELLKLARDSITSYFDKAEPDINNSQYSDKQGVFVTLHKNGELRGCIGFPEPIFPLNKAIVDASRHAAFEDPRFPPVKKEELEQIEIEMSILTVPQLLEVKNPDEYLDKIRIGTDGLIIRNSFASGLLLPQVATEQKWDALEFLDYVCLKAGLPQGAWKDLNNKIYTFQAEIFSEN